MPLKNPLPTLDQSGKLHTALEYNQFSDTIESYSNIYTSGNLSSSGMNCISTTTQQLYVNTITSYGNNEVKFNGNLQLTTEAYINFHTSMMEAVYSLNEEKDPNFCMPTSQAKTYLQLLLSHTNEEDADKLLRILYHSLSVLPINDLMLPSKHITSSIIEYCVKENI